MENLSTAGLAVATCISPSVVLMALDAGLLTGHVRLVAGRPVYAQTAVAALERAAQVADQHAAGQTPFAEAWASVKAPVRSETEAALA